jgi:transcriptional regulator with XRE-family HTH domain
MQLGQRIRKLRLDHHLTQSQLGQMLNLAESTISLYEANKRAPDYDILLRIANFFEVSLDYLMGLTDIPNVIRYHYSEAIPTVNDSNLSEISNLQNNNYFWYQVQAGFPSQGNIKANDLILIEVNPAVLSLGDLLLLQQSREAPQFYRLAQKGDPMILIPYLNDLKPEILTLQTLKQMALVGKVLELRRHYSS